MQPTPATNDPYWWRRPSAPTDACRLPTRPGQLCPTCQRGHLEYDALFRLVCPECGYAAEGGGYT